MDRLNRELPNTKARAPYPGGTAAEVPACRKAAAESPSEPWEAIDWTTTDRLLRDLRVGACIVLMFQAAYLVADQGRSEAHPEAILTLHIFNLLTALIFLGMAHSRAYADRIPRLIFGFCGLLFASTTALSILTGNGAPLTITLIITMMGVAALVPWDWRWQAGLAVAAAASMAALTLLRPAADPHLGYDWFALVTAAGVAQCGTLSGQRYRREIASRIAALQINHRFLGESEAKLRKIFETSNDAITINRLSDGRYLEVNEAFAATGYSREEALAQSAGALGVWGDRAQLREFMKTLRAKGSVVNMEIDLRTKEGRVDPFLISAKVIELDGEECMVTIGRDIRSIKQTEVDLTAAREAALAASTAKSEFLSSMSHEIRTPMNAILGMSELLSETELDPQQQKFVGIMQNNGNMLLELIDDILDLAKIESGRLNLEQTAFQLEELLDAIAESLAARAHGKGLELISRVVPDTSLHLVGDPLRLRQILINLLGNAIKFTKIGEIVLTVERDRESSEPGRLHFSVADTGVGIPASRLDRVFESFTQVDASTTRQYGGSGLGLAIVKRLVELMGGRLWVESEVGKGSIFHFTANLAIDNAARAENPAARPVVAALAGMRTLIVDDNATNRLLLHEILTPLDARLGEAASGAEALAALKSARDEKDPYHLMLLDCRMPHMDGIQVMEQLSDSGAQELVVLMLTSDDLRMKEPRARKIKLDAYIVKPIRKLELLEAIQKAIDARGQPQSVITEKSHYAAAPANVTAVDRPSLKILLVEDSPDNRLLVQAFLKHTPHRVVEAENGEIALCKFKQEPFDLVLMDIQMPVMDGLAATRAIRAWETLHQLTATPVVVLTASAFGEDVNKCFAAGATRHLGKPVKKAALLATIRDLTAGKRGSPHASAIDEPSSLSTA